MTQLGYSTSRSKHTIRNRLISGTLVSVPFAITFLLLKWLLDWAGGFLRPLVLLALEGRLPIRYIPGTYINVIDVFVSVLSIVLLLVALYLVGTIVQLVAGRKLISIGETIVLRIPLARSIYSAAKQVMSAVSLPNKGAFRSVVLVEYPRPGLRTLGFLTGTIQDETGKTYAKVFIPTPPNPLTGFLALVPVEEIVDTGMPLEEALKMIISGGVVSPPLLRFSRSQESAPSPSPVPDAPNQISGD